MRQTSYAGLTRVSILLGKKRFFKEGDYWVKPGDDESLARLRRIFRGRAQISLGIRVDGNYFQA